MSLASFCVLLAVLFEINKTPLVALLLYAGAFACVVLKIALGVELKA